MEFSSNFCFGNEAKPNLMGVFYLHKSPINLLRNGKGDGFVLLEEEGDGFRKTYLDGFGKLLNTYKGKCEPNLGNFNLIMQGFKSEGYTILKSFRDIQQFKSEGGDYINNL